VAARLSLAPRLHRLGENDAESPALSDKRRPDDHCAGLPADGMEEVIGSIPIRSTN
jgi:hypothetical protein